jgi:hypothetical protein
MRVNFVVLCIALTQLPLLAQNAGITGRVADSSDAVIVGADVTVTNEATGEVRRVATNADGYYTTPFLNSGSYSVSITRSGFKSAVRSGIKLEVQQGWRGVYTKRSTYSVSEPGPGKQPAFNWNTLYDREKDPYEQHNLSNSPAHGALKEKMHKLTFSWMDKFHDSFLSGAELMKICFNEKPQALLLQRPDNVRPPGDPVDLLAQRNRN